MYNEAASAAATIETISAWLKANVTDRKWAIAVTDDGSKDETGIILAGLRSAHPYLLVTTHPQNRGYGAAVRTSFATVAENGFDYALVMDADGTQDPKYIANFFVPMAKGTEFIKATRYSKGGGMVGVPFMRQLNSYVGNTLAKIILRLPISDYTNGFRAIHKRLLPQLNTQENGFAMLIEEVTRAKALGATFDEVPYILTARIDPGSKSKFVYAWPTYKSYLRNLFLKK